MSNSSDTRSPDSRISARTRGFWMTGGGLAGVLIAVVIIWAQGDSGTVAIPGMAVIGWIIAGFGVGLIALGDRAEQLWARLVIGATAIVIAAVGSFSTFAWVLPNKKPPEPPAASEEQEWERRDRAAMNSAAGLGSVIVLDHVARFRRTNPSLMVESLPGALIDAGFARQATISGFEDDVVNITFATGEEFSADNPGAWMEAQPQLGGWELLGVEQLQPKPRNKVN